MSLGNIKQDPNDPTKTIICGLSGVTPEVKKKYSLNSYIILGAIGLGLLFNNKDMATAAADTAADSATPAKTQEHRPVEPPRDHYERHVYMPLFP